MKTYARVESNRVAEILETDNDITTMFHPSLQWIDCTDIECHVGWEFDGVTFSSPSNSIAQQPVASVTMRQARLVLLNQGKLAEVGAAINALPSPQKEEAQIEWEYSQFVERDRPFVVSIGAALGLSHAQLDELFTLASTL